MAAAGPKPGGGHLRREEAARCAGRPRGGAACGCGSGATAAGSDGGATGRGDAARWETGVAAAGGEVGDDVGDGAETGGRLGRRHGGQQRLVPRSRRRREVGSRAGDGTETAVGRGRVAVGGQRWLVPSARRQRLWRRGGHDNDGATAARTLSRLVPLWLDPAVHDRISPRRAPAGLLAGVSLAMSLLPSRGLLWLVEVWWLMGGIAWMWSWWDDGLCWREAGMGLDVRGGLPRCWPSVFPPFDFPPFFGRTLFWSWGTLGVGRMLRFAVGVYGGLIVFRGWPRARLCRLLRSRYECL
uniref:Uncharacterized protein n=1 Tax=Oryza barthii TaxID=65489 RepID=A0A0D3GPA0_9ORYZ